MAAVRWMVEREERCRPAGGILADDVGLGKTYVASGLVRDAPLWPTLIVVPKNVVWEWVSVLRKSMPERYPFVLTKTAMASEVGRQDLVVTTHTMLGRRDVPPDISCRVWGRVVVDEAHVLRNGGTLLHRSLTALIADAKWALTATPLQNGASDLLSLAAYVGIKTSTVEDVREFMLRRLQTDDGMRVVDGGGDNDGSGGGGNDGSGGGGNDGSGAAPLSDKRQLCVKLACVRLDDEERRLYDALHRDLEQAIARRSSMTSVKNKSDTSLMEAVLRCRQAATHPGVYHRSAAASSRCTHEDALHHEREATRWGGMGSSKMRALYEDIDSHDEKCLIFCDWLDEMTVIKEYLESRNVDCLRYDGRLSITERQDILYEFSNIDGPRVLLIQVNCGGSGLNLQIASRVYFMRPSWNPAIEYQAVGRAHRSGQTRRVVVTKLQTVDTVDDMLAIRQRIKIDEITAILRDNAMERHLCPSEPSEPVSEGTPEQIL